MFIPISTMRSRIGDLEVRRESGTFTVENYQLSRIEIVLDQPDAIPGSTSIVQRSLKQYHPDPDFEVRVSR